jgi:hypothetical protein
MSESWGERDTVSEVVLASVEVQGCKLWTAIDWSRERALVQIRTRWCQIGPARAMPVHRDTSLYCWHYLLLAVCCPPNAQARAGQRDGIAVHMVGGSSGQHVRPAKVSTWLDGMHSDGIAYVCHGP